MARTSSGRAATTRRTRRCSAGHTSRGGVATRSRTTTSPARRRCRPPSGPWRRRSPGRSPRFDVPWRRRSAWPGSLRSFRGDRRTACSSDASTPASTPCRSVGPPRLPLGRDHCDRPANSRASSRLRLAVRRHHRQHGAGRARQDGADRAGGHVPARRGPPADRGRAGRRQDEPGQGAGGVDRLHVEAGPVHARPAARRPRRRQHLPALDRAVPASSRARCSPTSCSPTRSTGPRRRPSRRCSRRWRSARSPSTARRRRSTPPFMVIATQNPVDQEGTYRLPESQLDRFLLRISLGYPGPGRRDGDPRRPRRRRVAARSWPGRVGGRGDVDDRRRAQRVPRRRAQGLPRRPGRGQPPPPGDRARPVAAGHAAAGRRRPGPTPPPAAGATPRPTTSRRWPCLRSPTACSCAPTAAPGSTRSTPSARCSPTSPCRRRR